MNLAAQNMSAMFTCAECGQTFKKGRSDEEALAEKSDLFSNVAIEDCVVVCDICWRKIMVVMHPCEGQA